MKSNFIRLLTTMTLATSISAFALPGNTAAGEKNANNKKPEVTTPASTANEGMAGQRQGQPNNSEDKSRQQLIEEQNKQWLHDLLGIYG
jgi:hypothetical protein